MPASDIVLKYSLPDLDMGPGRRQSSAGQTVRHCGIVHGLLNDSIYTVSPFYFSNNSVEN